MSLKVNIEEAYATACQMIGEGVVRERLLSKALSQKDQIIKVLQEHMDADVAKAVIEEATGIVEEAPNATQGDEQGKLQQN